MTLTKSWLQKQITDLEANRDEIPFGLDEDGNNTLAAFKTALAGMEVEPVAFVKSGYALCYYRPPSEYGLKIGDKLYAAAQPATVVPDEQHSERFDWTLGQWAEHVGGRHQGDDPANYYEFGSFMAVAAMLRQFGTVQQKLGWNACRAAMLQAGNSPVTPDGWVACSERMPEEGGRYLAWVTQQNSLGLSGWADNVGYHPDDIGFRFNGVVTHWQPLPAAPQQEAE